VIDVRLFSAYFNRCTNELLGKLEASRYTEPLSQMFAYGSVVSLGIFLRRQQDISKDTPVINFYYNAYVMTELPTLQHFSVSIT